MKDKINESWELRVAIEDSTGISPDSWFRPRGVAVQTEDSRTMRHFKAKYHCLALLDSKDPYFGTKCKLCQTILRQSLRVLSRQLDISSIASSFMCLKLQWEPDFGRNSEPHPFLKIALRVWQDIEDIRYGGGRIPVSFFSLWHDAYTYIYLISTYSNDTGFQWHDPQFLSEIHEGIGASSTRTTSWRTVKVWILNGY